MDCNDIIDEIILHEILGTETVSGVSGDGDFNLTFEEDDVFVASGVDTVNMSDEFTVTDAGSGQVNIELKNLKVDDDLLWVYDGTRGKWLSSSRFNPSAGERGRARNKYLLVVDGQATNLSGYRLIRGATITAISAQTRDIGTWTLRVRKNGDPTNLASLVMSGVDGNHSTAIDLDLDEGDRVQFYAETTTLFGIRDPLVWVEVAWRNDTLIAP